VALVHHPVLGRSGEILTTTITNLDLHDIARIGRTYDLHAFYAVHPAESQRRLAERIRSHWVSGAGGRRIPPRARALELLELVADLDEARAALAADFCAPSAVELWTTAADARGGEVSSYAEARAALGEGEAPVLLLFGTGWGLAPELVAQAHRRLAPIAGRAGYNHLSVRAACAITLDRLLG
jgi:hypothetical protein